MTSIHARPLGLTSDLHGVLRRPLGVSREYQDSATVALKIWWHLSHCPSWYNYDNCPQLLYLWQLSPVVIFMTSIQAGPLGLTSDLHGVLRRPLGVSREYQDSATVALKIWWHLSHCPSWYNYDNCPQLLYLWQVSMPDPWDWPLTSMGSSADLLGSLGSIRIQPLWHWKFGGI